MNGDNVEYFLSWELRIYLSNIKSNDGVSTILGIFLPLNKNLKSNESGCEMFILEILVILLFQTLSQKAMILQPPDKKAMIFL